MRRAFIILIVLFVTSCVVDKGEEFTGLSGEKDMIQYDDAQWPTNSTTLSSPFGPRLKASEDFRYDFHRGIDIPGALGDPVYVLADGIVASVYLEGEEGSPYPSGGTVVIVEHTMDTPFSFHGQEFLTYYSLYMHLDSVAIDAGDAVAKGAVIGTLGHSGETTFDHLHLEIRIGSRCSREYQREHPETACAHIFPEPTDPHVNPFLFLPYGNGNSLSYSIDSLNPLTITVTSDYDELDLNEIVVSYRGIEKRVNFNDRVGIDPENIDNPEYDGVTISPALFNSTSKQYAITFTFSGFDGYDSIEVRDIWGTVARGEGL